jgi:hypothetical protein
MANEIDSICNWLTGKEEFHKKETSISSRIQKQEQQIRMLMARLPFIHDADAFRVECKEKLAQMLHEKAPIFPLIFTVKGRAFRKAEGLLEQNRYQEAAIEMENILPEWSQKAKKTEAVWMILKFYRATTAANHTLPLHILPQRIGTAPKVTLH